MIIQNLGVLSSVLALFVHFIQPVLFLFLFFLTEIVHINIAVPNVHWTCSKWYLVLFFTFGHIHHSVLLGIRQ